MSISSEITRINQNIASAYTACNSKGATMPQTQNSANLAAAITSITTGGGSTLIPKTITENGVYNASSDNADGYDVVTVGVPQDPDENFDKFMNNTLEHYSTTATAIPEYCFLNKTNMTSITMPNVVSLGGYAFDGCSSLVLSSLPTTIVTIPQNCFRGCSSLDLETLPTSLTAISQYSFYQATLAITKLPSGITSIGNQAFRFVKGISYLDMSEVLQIPKLGVNAFQNSTFPFYFADQTQLDAYAAATNWSTYASRFQIKPSGVI